MSEKLSSFLDQTILCKNIQDLEALCTTFLASFGIEHFICANMHGLPCAADRRPLFGTYESPWMKHYMGNSYYADDVLMQNVRGINGDYLPYYWSDIQMAKQLTQIQNTIFKEAWDVGLKEGLMIPLQTGASELAVFSMAGPGLKRNVSTKGVLHSAAIQAHAKARQILLQDYTNQHMPNRVQFSAKPNVSALTSSEINVIQMLAEDLGPITIAKAKNISVSTVRKHIDAAKKKMLTDELTGLVAIAYRQGLIT